MTRKTSFQVGIAGRKGQGKTVLSDSLARGRPRVVCFDFLGEYRAKGYVQVRTLDALKAEIRKRWKKGFRVSYFPSARFWNDRKKVFEHDFERDLSEVSELLCKIQQPYFDTPDGKTPPVPKLLLIVEEMRWSYPQNCSYQGFAVLCTLGRHYGIDVIGTTQRIAEISTNFRGTCDVRFFFAQEEHTDVTTIAKMIGTRNVGKLQALRPHEFLRFYGGQVTLHRNKLK